MSGFNENGAAGYLRIWNSFFFVYPVITHNVRRDIGAHVRLDGTLINSQDGAQRTDLFRLLVNDVWTVYRVVLLNRKCEGYGGYPTACVRVHKILNDSVGVGIRWIDQKTNWLEEWIKNRVGAPAALAGR